MLIKANMTDSNGRPTLRIINCFNAMKIKETEINNKNEQQTNEILTSHN